jgi:hypothetical protein
LDEKRSSAGAGRADHRAMEKRPCRTTELRYDILEMLRHARPGSDAARALRAQLERLDASRKGR